MASRTVPGKSRSTASPASTPNRLLAALTPAEATRFAAASEAVELRRGTLLCEAGEPMRHAYFPLAGFISLISAIDGRPRLEVGLVGREGMVGAPLLLGVDVAPLRALVQGDGGALRIDAAALRAFVARTPAFGRVLDRYVFVLMTQLAQMAACTRFHLVEPRLARWLLMTRDRGGRDDFSMTQGFLAYMLGVRRAGIAQAAAALQRRRLIRYVRGNITILDGPGLEARACECFASANAIYARALG
jgi:CRP-like cAMP-binding protein